MMNATLLHLGQDLLDFRSEVALTRQRATLSIRKPHQFSDPVHPLVAGEKARAVLAKVGQVDHWDPTGSVSGTLPNGLQRVAVQVRWEAEGAQTTLMIDALADDLWGCASREAVDRFVATYQGLAATGLVPHRRRLPDLGLVAGACLFVLSIGLLTFSGIH